MVAQNSVVYEQCRNCDVNESANRSNSLLTRVKQVFTKTRRSASSSISIPLPPPEDTSSTISESSTGASDDQDRETWGRQLDFFLSCVGYAVGLGNVWRFPYLCYRSGGGAFLIPYLLFLLICGMPLFYMEMSFGQFASLGPIAIWRISPLFKGLGYGMVLISAIVCIYYNVIIAWTLFYIYQSYSVSWATCGNWWNTENCVDKHQDSAVQNVSSMETSNNISALISIGSELFNGTSRGEIDTIFENSTFDIDAVARKQNALKMASSEEFWINYVLRLSSGIEEVGELQWPLVLALLLAWVLVFLCLLKGIKSSGKVVYITATFPYIVLVCLLVRGLTLPGAWKGIAFYLTPRWELLMTFRVWGDAATQIFYSVGAAWGAVLTMASYNKFSNNVYRDSILIPLINCATSVFAGFVVFSVIGFMSYETGKPIEEVVKQGPGLAFVVYPEAVSRLPFSPIWAFLFFIMLFTIGLDSQFAMFETAISAFVDEFPNLLKKRKVAFTAFLCLMMFLLGLPCVTQGGMYVLQLLDWYSATFSLMIISFLETIAISWVYGIDRFVQDTYLMIKRVPSIWWKLCWKYITPGSIACILLFIFINHEPVTYNGYVYPYWSVIVGWLIALCSIIPIPLLAVIQLCKAEGSFKERVITCLRPTPEWGPALEEHRIQYKKSLGLISSRFPQPIAAALENSSPMNAEQEHPMVQKESTNLQSESMV